jgi:flagellin-like hook-associated protein FlgL
MAVISSAVRNNLLALTNTTAQQAVSQNRLATGKKVNSALDNPTNFFTAQSLSNRASGLSSLLDGMSNGIKTLEAADNGMKAITKNIETMQANIRSARSDKSFKGESRTISDTAAGNLTFSGGALGTAPDVNVDVGTYKGKLVGGTYTALDFRGADGADTLADTADDTYQKLGFSIALDGGATTAVEVQGGVGNKLSIKVGSATAEHTVTDIDTVTAADMVAALNKGFKAAGLGVTASGTGPITFEADKGIATKATAAVAVSAITTTDNTVLVSNNFGFASGTTASTVAGQGKTVDEMVKAIADTSALTGKVRATNDGGKLRIENLGTTEMTVTGMSATAVNGGTGASNQTKIGGNEVRKNLITQFNDLRTQTDKLVGDASFNGINLLRADKLKLTFNEDGTNNIEIQAKDTTGSVRAIDTSEKSLGIGAATDAEFSDDAQLDARLDALSKSLTTLTTQASTFGSALTTIQTRQDFTKNMINTLQAGADSLVNADLNEESATLLALNTRQQLSQTALSLASQADQAVLRLF